MHHRFVTALFVLLTVAAIGTTSAAAAPGHVSVYFLQGEQLAPRQRARARRRSMRSGS